jgi:hypothetical protein
MRTIQIAPTAAGEVTDETLKLGPPRLLTFLQGVSDPAIRAQFAPLGWSDERLDEAWSLLTELKAANKIPATPVPDPVTEAIASCEAWQATGLIRARAMLQLTFPEQASFMFHDFVAGSGTAAVLNVATFLDRLQVLENGADRKGSRKADHEALAVIDDTGATKEVLKQLRGLVEAVQTVAPTQPQHLVDADAKRTEVLRKIHAWITAWSEMARTVITRRDQMIKLGIAKRRSHKGKSAVGTPTAPPVAPAPPPVVSPVVTPTPPIPPARATSTSLADEDETSPESRAA